MVYEVTPSALGPLLGAFWSARGWREPPDLPVGPDLDRAVASGVVFEGPTQRDHDGWVDAARRAAQSLSIDEVSSAFVGSLTSRRLDLRSALGSYAVARHLPEHPFRTGASERLCRVCGLTADPAPQDLNVLSFERFKWGGVRRDDLRYVAFDLEQLALAPRHPVDEAAVALGRRLLQTLREVPADETATGAVSRLGLVRGNISERAVLLDVLGVCGVLAAAGRPGHLTDFVPYDERAHPSRHFVERAYPVSWWRGSDGVDEEAVRTFLAPLA